MIGDAHVWQSKDGSGDVPFPPVKDATVSSVAHARSSKVWFYDYTSRNVRGLFVAWPSEMVDKVKSKNLSFRNGRDGLPVLLTAYHQRLFGL